MKFLKSAKLDNDLFNFVPGPGHYESKSSTNGRHIPKGSKPIPHTAFGQGTMRFSDLNSEVNIGPGQYFGVNDWSSKPKKEAKNQLQQNTRKIVTIPSIPATTHAMGYVEREDGYLVPLNGANIKESEDMGPGVYTPNDALTKKKVLGHSIEKGSVRFPVKKVDDNTVKPTPQPEIYNLPNKQITEREIPAKKKEKPKRSEPQENPIEKLLNYPVIPPGHYYNEKLASSFNVKTKAAEYQNFGSSAKRFIPSRNKTPVPGPGAYGVPNLDVSNSNMYATGKQEPFSKGDIRFRSVGAIDHPGPGNYDANFNMTPAGAYSNATSNFSAAFGGGANRFVSPKIEDKPGPGAYEITRKPKKNKNKKNRGGKLVVPPSHYNSGNIDHQTRINKALELDLGGRTKGAVTVKHEHTLKGTAAFNPLVQRFKEESRDINPGPGSYHSNGRNDFIKPSFLAHKENFSLASRDPISKLDQYKRYVGPGSYDGDVELVKPKTNLAPKINPISPFADINLAFN